MCDVCSAKLLEVFEWQHILVLERRHVEPPVLRVALKVPRVPRVRDSRDNGGLQRKRREAEFSN